MTSAPGLMLLLGRQIMLRCRIQGGGERAGRGFHRDGCGCGRKGLRQLAHAASYRSPTWHRVAVKTTRYYNSNGLNQWPGLEPARWNAC
eukprot:1157504-Pelagomonas_calceolata.AAC.1